MARRNRQNRRVRKRIFVVSGLSALAVCLIAGILSYCAAALVGTTDLVRFSVEEGDSRLVLLGGGISISQAESANLARDSSFEPLVFRQALTVFSGDATTLTVSSEDASAGLYGDGFFDGASARVMTQNESGMALKKTAEVTHYGINRVGVFQPVNLPGDMPPQTAILSFARLDDLSVAVGRSGLIIRNVTGQMPEIEESGITANLTGICAASQGFLACSDEGDVLASPDGQSWQELPGMQQDPLSAIASTEEGLLVAVGTRGTIVTGTVATTQDGQLTGQLTALQTGTQADLNDIAYGLSTFVAVGERGTILISKTGLFWQEVVSPEETGWRAIDFRDGRFALAGDNGAIALSDDGRTFRQAEGISADEQPAARTDYVDIVMLSRQQLIVLDQDGSFFVSNDSGESWLQSGIDTGMKSWVIALAGKDKILSADASGQLGLAELVAEIQLDSPLKEGQYQAGDQIFLEKATVGIPENYLAASPADLDQDPWNFYGNGSCERVDDNAAPEGGTASMLLQAIAGTPGQAAILSQAIDPDLLSDVKSNETFRVDLWMKQSNVADRMVKLWLTGPFEPVGTAFTNVSSSWKKYSFTFVLPLWTSSPENRNIRLNIAIDSGSVWLDRISFSLVNEDTDLLAASYRTEIAGIAPEFIRLDFLDIGCRSVRQDSWAYPLGNETPYLSSTLGRTIDSCSSLYAALQLVKSSHADPWLVLDSYTSEAELLNLVEYLAGPISEPYGKIRQEQGEALPWTEPFNRILIEITDSCSLYETDRQKADFVDLLIKTISQSPYYRQIKGKLIFIDSMTYRDGVVLSTADYHASDLNGQIAPDRSAAIAATYLSYYDEIPRNPDKPIQTWHELIRSARLRPNGTNVPNLADLTELMLRDLGDQSILCNLELPDRRSQDWQSCWPAAAAIASSCARGTPLAISDATGNINKDVFAHGFANNEQIAIALTNLSEQPATCQLLTDLPLQNAVVYRYDDTGNLLSSQALRQRDKKISLLPGGVILIMKDLTGP